MIAHELLWLTRSRAGSQWGCACGATGMGWGNPTVGWALHVAREGRDR